MKMVGCERPSPFDSSARRVVGVARREIWGEREGGEEVMKGQEGVRVRAREEEGGKREEGNLGTA